MSDDQWVPSESRANKAGDRLRRVADGRLDLQVDIDQELAVLSAWRAQFKVPSSSTAMTLRSMVRTVTGDVPSGVVTERFKRESQIVAKLRRSKTRLSKMEDIGGCRAVLPDLATVYKVRDRIHSHARALTVTDEDDYNETPRPGGYRALHLHALRGDVQIEVQLRTRGQHHWAGAIEAWDAASHHDIKHERGPAQIVEAFRLMADVQAELDQGQGVTLWATLTRRRAGDLFRAWMEERGA